VLQDRAVQRLRIGADRRDDWPERAQAPGDFIYVDVAAACIFVDEQQRLREILLALAAA
jgi:hypothetical protein